MERGKPVLIGGDPKGNNIVYCTGNSVIIRNVKEPRLADTYSEHIKNPTVARYAPSGYYMASGDEMGNVRIWDTTQPGVNPIKLDIRALGGKVFDIAWSDDSKRVCAVGDGREKFGACFFMDGGASCGEISGHSKPITSVDIKQTRPYRIITGSEDFKNGWFEGPPFKWKKTMDGHSRFINCVRFSPNGERAISVGQDKLAVVFDGKTGEKISQLDVEHKGGVYCVSWSASNTQVLTASADKTCKIWDVETGKSVTTFDFGSDVNNQQLGCIWQGGDLISIGLNGYLNYLDPASGKVYKQVHGHQNFVTAFAYDQSSDSFVTGSYDSSQIRWNVKDASTEIFEGAGHTNQISQLVVDGANIFSAGMDDSFGIAPLAGGAGSRVATDSPARGIASAGGNAVGVSMKTVNLIRGGAIVSKINASWSPTCVAISPCGTTAVVGGEDKNVHVFKIDGASITESKVLSGHAREISAIAYSPDGKYIASGCKNRNIILWNTSDFSTVVDGQWGFHTSTINGLAFSPDSQVLASAGLDQDIYFWSPAKISARHRVALAHKGGINNILWLNNNELATGGADCCVKTYTFDRAVLA